METKHRSSKRIPLPSVLLAVATVGIFILVIALSYQVNSLTSTSVATYAHLESSQDELLDAWTALDTLRGEDQFVRNEALEQTITSIEDTYTNAAILYDDLLALKEKTDDTEELDALFAQALSELSERKYTSAGASLASLSQDITALEVKIASQFTIPADVAVSSAPPGAGFSRQKVETAIGGYLVDIVAADLGSTRVIVDTASDGDCFDNCPVLSLGEYVARNGAFAGINGTYFCPASYASCAGKTNTFDLLVMNKNKTYFNSDNNVYSTNPAVIFGGGWVRFEGAASGWGRDTGVDGVISNFPLLVSGGNSVFAGDSDPKKGSKAGRSFVASKGNTVYIGVVYNSTVAEAATVLSTMGMEHAMNLDSGGSTALWSGGYKAGPGRNIPNAILFVGK